MGCLALAAIGLHLASIHSHTPTNKVYGPEYNNNNPGVYVQTECGLTVGAYYNSLGRLSTHVGFTVDIPHTPLFVSGGVATGYYAPVIPMGMVGLRADRGPVRMRIGYIPKVGKINDTHVVHLMIERRF